MSGRKPAPGTFNLSRASETCGSFVGRSCVRHGALTLTSQGEYFSRISLQMSLISPVVAITVYLIVCSTGVFPELSVQYHLLIMLFYNHIDIESALFDPLLRRRQDAWSSTLRPRSVRGVCPMRQLSRVARSLRSTKYRQGWYDCCYPADIDRPSTERWRT